MLSLLKNQSMVDGATGRVAFDDNGDRLDSDYDIVNAVNGRVKTVGKYHFVKDESQMKLHINLNDITWPGGGKSKVSKFGAQRSEFDLNM